MIRRLLVAAVVSVCVVCSGTATAASSSHGSSRASSGTKGRASPKPVHVKTSTKKDGTRVEAHDRQAPEPKTSTPHVEPVRAAPPPFRLVVTDPVTGRRTFTNEPLALLPARALATTAATVSTPPPASVRQTMTIAPSSAGVHDARDRIQRSAAARHAFARQTGFPNGRPGYVIDHIKPLACGGVDAPSNMHWQTIAASKAKDKIERDGCR
jgi:hypothetical protein